MAAGFYQYQTWDLKIRIKREGALQGAEHVKVSVSQLGNKVDFDDEELGLDVENDIINLHMEQEDTGRFSEGTAKLQVNILHEDTRRNVTAKATLEVYDNLHKEVMT